MFKTRSWNGCGYKDYVNYLIRECHMDRYDAMREATDEFRLSNADNNAPVLMHNTHNGVGVLSNR